MKKITIVLALVISVLKLQAQEFKNTDKYSVMTRITNKMQEYPPYTIDVVDARDKDKLYTSFTIEDTEFLEQVSISTLNEPGLDGVSEVVKVEVEYSACCSIVAAHYFLTNVEGNFIALPRLENIYCDTPESDFHYTFPNQEYGISGTILQTEAFYDLNTYEVKYIGLKGSFAWEVDEMKTTDSLAEAGY